jgi:hypothetical protein
MGYVWSLLLTLSVYLLLRWEVQQRLTPDGLFYQGQIVSRPYTLRWLLPLICQKSMTRWSWVSGVSLIACGPLIYHLTHSLFAVSLFVGLPWFRVNTAFPVLTDQTAMALSLGGVALLPTYPLFSIPLFLLAGACNEKGPVFAAAWTLNPLPLLGLLAVGWWTKSMTVPEPWLQHPIREARKTHQFMNPLTFLLPWGLLAILVPLSWTYASPQTQWIMAISLILAHAQLFIALDNARLTQWAAPALLATAAAIVPVPLQPFLALIHIFANPYRGV